MGARIQKFSVPQFVKLSGTQNKQESRAAAVVFGLKFADNIHYKFKSNQASKAMLQSSKHTGANRI